MLKLDLEKAEEPEIKLPTSVGSSKKQENSRKTFTSALLTANAGDVRDVDLLPESRRSPGGEHSNPLQYSCLENPTVRGGWRGVVHGVAQLSD